MPDNAEPPKGLGGIPLGWQIGLLVGSPVIALLTLGGMFFAKGRGALAPAPNPATGQVYEVCIGRGGCTPGYLTHREYIIYQITQAPIWIIITMGAAFIVFGILLRIRKWYRQK